MSIVALFIIINVHSCAWNATHEHQTDSMHVLQQLQSHKRGPRCHAAPHGAAVPLPCNGALRHRLPASSVQRSAHDVADVARGQHGEQLEDGHEDGEVAQVGPARIEVDLRKGREVEEELKFFFFSL